VSGDGGTNDSLVLEYDIKLLLLEMCSDCETLTKEIADCETALWREKTFGMIKDQVDVDYLYFRLLGLKSRLSRFHDKHSREHDRFVMMLEKREDYW